MKSSKTMKQFEAEWMGKPAPVYGTVDVCFSFKPWFGEFEGRKVYVAAYRNKGWRDCEAPYAAALELVHAEFADTGEEFPAVCTHGFGKNDLEGMMLGC